MTSTASQSGDDPTDAATNQTDAATSLQKLKDWIDKPHPFEQKENTCPVFLHKSKFTIDILKEGLIYAVSKYQPLAAEHNKLEEIAVKQYRNELEGWLELYGIDENAANLCLLHEISSADYAIEIREADLSADEKKLLLRTVAAMARLVERFKDSNADLRRGIGVLQGDVEPNFKLKPET